MLKLESQDVEDRSGEDYRGEKAIITILCHGQEQNQLAWEGQDWYV